MTEISRAAQDKTLDRLLRSAVDVFAEYGYRAATVREICRRAEVNIASVNYYFRSKEALYTQALAFAFQDAEQRYPQDRALDTSLPAAARLQFFVESFLQMLMDDSHLGLHSKMITREITEPTHALDQVVNIAIRPRCRILTEIVLEIMGTNFPKETIDRCVVSILGQCLIYKHSRSVIERVFPQLLADPDAPAQNAKHIVAFSLHGLTAIGQRSAGEEL